MTQDKHATINALMIEFDCLPLAKGSQRENKRRETKRQRVLQTHQAYRVIRPFVNTQDEAVEAVRKQMTAGMGPIAAWFFWQFVSVLVRAVVAWLVQNESQSVSVTSKG
jgi:hypothetical protein